MNYLKLLLIYAAIIVLTCLSAYYALNFIFNFYKNYELNQIQPKDSLDFYIDRLAEYECYKCPYGFRKMDNNGKFSYGNFQFQEETFLEGIKKYNLLPGLNDVEVMNMIYNDQIQRSLVRKIFLNEPNAYLYWKTSIITRGLGLPPLE